VLPRPAYNCANWEPDRHADGRSDDHGGARETAGSSTRLNGVRRLDLRQLGPGLLGFWALYFAIVTLSNLTDILANLHVLPAGWRWVSGNLAFMTASTGKLGVPVWINPILLAGVIAWQGLASFLFWRAAWEPDGRWLGPAFVVSLSLWASFVLLDEVLLIFETGTHLRLLIAELLTLVVLRIGGPPWARGTPDHRR
jgi:hypothetical protein